MRVKCIVSYDGSNYNGYQRQPGTKTIQGTIESVLNQMTKEDIIIYSSGRTDAFVHAKGQVFHFDTLVSIKPMNWKNGLNSLLPTDIRIRDVEFVEDDFHSRFSHDKKEYRYYIHTGQQNPFYDHFSTNIYNLDVNKMKEAIKLLEGMHDYKGFAGDTKNKDTVRTIYEASINTFDEFIEIKFIGNGFLKYMVRIMVGTLVDIGLGKKDITVINKIFETKDRNLAGKTIEAKGLFLYQVYYLSFNKDMR